MIGRERGLVSRLRARHPDLMAYHCIIHQMVLCASHGERYSEVMTTVMKLVNYLRASSALQHRLLRSFLIEVNATFDDLLYWSGFGHCGKSWRHFCWNRRVQKPNHLWIL